MHARRDHGTNQYTKAKALGKENLFCQKKQDRS